MINWQEVKLGYVCDLIAGFAFKSKDFGNYPDKVIKITNIEPPFVNTANLIGIDISKYNRDKLKKFSATKGDYVLAMTGATIGKLGRICEGKAYINQRVLMFKPTEAIDKKFLYYNLVDNKFMQYVLNHIDSESAQANISATTIGKYEFSIPSLGIQKQIAGVLGALDNKIELNNKVNNNLEQQAQALFKSWFVDFEPFGGKMPDDWKVENLLDIADYLNGLAMQKFRPENNDYGLPILKIKELRQGFCDNNSERCNSNIKEDYIIYDGDVIFSWSGSLLVDLWCGGKCGLNQHLFKVTSKKFDKWFYYAWTRYHLKSFIAVAADKATTMGHIKRNELEKAKVIIPTSEDYQKISKTLAPIYDMIIQNRIENTRLAQLRDTLLPKLMSGEIDVSDVNISADKSSFSDGIYFMCYLLNTEDVTSHAHTIVYDITDLNHLY